MVTGAIPRWSYHQNFASHARCALARHESVLFALDEAIGGESAENNQDSGEFHDLPYRATPLPAGRRAVPQVTATEQAAP